MTYGDVITAMVTPFDSRGFVDFEKITNLINYLIENGSDAIVVCGTTGESPTLTLDEKEAIFSHSVKIADKRIPVIAGTGSNSTFASVELTRKAELCGVDGIMLVAPYYNKPSQRGLYEHFKSVAENTSLPVMIYNVPGRTVVNILPETTIALSKIGNITSVKEASGNLDQITTIATHVPPDFQVFSGDDSITIPALAVGAHGVVSVASHIIGLEIKEMIQSFKRGEVESAAKQHQSLLPIMRGMFIAPNPAPVKTALQMKGIDAGGVRLPIVPLTLEEKKIISALLQQAENE